ncbi:FIST signal transduction protein [Pseudodesulfovibrio cashew]|nr:FIST C-terminal domain-containing protein [Pseudodesulfovibrio cashew]
MRVFIDREGTLAGLRQAMDSALENGAGSLLIFSCDGNGYESECLDPLLRSTPVPLSGGIFPRVLGDGLLMEKGNVVVAMDEHPETYVVRDMNSPAVDFEDVLDRMVAEETDARTVLVFVDGLSSRIGAFVDALYSIFGLEVNYIGGGAGSLSFRRTPCVFTNEGVLRDAAVLGAYHMESGVGVSHGWEYVKGPFKVTESEGNLIKSLDWRPAFEVYREVVEAHSGKRFMLEPFFDIAQSYPFGIAKMGAERVVRDPMGLDGEEALVCIGDIPEGAYVDILHGSPENLIQAAGSSLRMAKENFPPDARPRLGFFIDCISRALFLDDEYRLELEAMTEQGMESVGICSMGELANSGQDYLEFYNMTAVVALLEGR